MELGNQELGSWGRNPGSFMSDGTNGDWPEGAVLRSSKSPVNGEPVSGIDTSIQLCRLDRSCLRQRDRGIAAPHVSALPLPIQDTVAITIGVQVNTWQLVNPSGCGRLGLPG